MQPYCTTSSLNIKFPMHLTVKLSRNKFYHYKSSCKIENILKNILAIIFISLVSWILFPIMQFKENVYFITCYWDSCPFQQLLKITSILKVTSFSFIITWSVKNFRSTISSLYKIVIQYVCKTSLLKNLMKENKYSYSCI